MKDYKSKNAVFPMLYRRNSSCIDSESLNQQQPSESSYKEQQEDKLRKGNTQEK